MAYELLNNVGLAANKPCAMADIHLFVDYLNAYIIVYRLEGSKFAAVYPEK